MSGRMKKKIAGLSAAIGSVVAALVGSSAFGENPWITNIVVGGLAITMVLNLFTSEDISRDLRNGTFEELIRSEEHTSELQSLMRISYAVFCLKKKTRQKK